MRFHRGRAGNGRQSRHEVLLAHACAQSEALMMGSKRAIPTAPVRESRLLPRSTRSGRCSSEHRCSWRRRCGAPIPSASSASSWANHRRAHLPRCGERGCIRRHATCSRSSALGQQVASDGDRGFQAHRQSLPVAWRHRREGAIRAPTTLAGSANGARALENSLATRSSGSDAAPRAARARRTGRHPPSWTPARGAGAPGCRSRCSRRRMRPTIA